MGEYEVGAQEEDSQRRDLRNALKKREIQIEIKAGAGQENELKLTDSQRQLLILFYNSTAHTHTHTLGSERDPLSFDISRAL